MINKAFQGFLRDPRIDTGLCLGLQKLLNQSIIVFILEAFGWQSGNRITINVIAKSVIPIKNPANLQPECLTNIKLKVDS